jgi:hypothetical protein
MMPKGGKSSQQSLGLSVVLTACLLLLAKDNIVLHLFNLFIYFQESYSGGRGEGWEVKVWVISPSSPKEEQRFQTFC